MRKGGQLKFLSQDQIEDIYHGALNILQYTGVKIPLENIRKELKAVGCMVDGELVKMPASLVESLIKKAPCRFTLFGRDPEYQIGIEGRKVFFQPMIGRLNILDSKTGKKRRTNIYDVMNLVRVADFLPNYHILHSGAIMPHIEGLPDEVSHVYGYVASVKNSSKIIKGTCRGLDKAIDCIEMASIIAGGESKLRQKPNIHTTYNVISPLEHGREMLEGLAEYVKFGLPVDITSEPQTGATSPVTIGGTLAQQAAELFSGVVITQVLNPGTPVFVGTCGAAMNMRYGTIALGGIEAALLNVGHAQIAQFCGLPTRGTGSNTCSKVLDFQAGYEKALTLLFPALAGINMIFYPGTIEHAETISIESLLLDHEICSLVTHALKGISVNEETLALQIIAKKGPGGFFINERHTIDFLEQEHFLSEMADHRKREDWEKSGGKDMATLAVQEVEQILDEHKPIPLEDKIKEELVRVVNKTEKRAFGNKGKFRIEDLL